MASRYIVGIDLGTTHTAMAYADLSAHSTASKIHVFNIPQTVRPGYFERRALLPSCVYLPGEHEFAEGSLALPWSDLTPRTAAGIAYTVGEFARARGLEVPGRLVASAKSWLCQGGADTRLPFHAQPGVPALNPVEISSLILKHLAAAWAFEFAREPEAAKLQEQRVILCVPASFDAAARDLTFKAAQMAGFEDICLLEEPQAAFYAWIEQSANNWRREIAPGELVLVIDIGGGTTDFSLISLEDNQGALSLRRTAVGEHILLGGDNMDMALADAVARRLADTGVDLDHWQLRGLELACRDAKEILLAARVPGLPPPLIIPLQILGRGGSVIGKSVKAMLSRDGAERTILEGFFAKCESLERPRLAVMSGLKETGLQYAADAAIAKHLAKFMAEAGRIPSAILFNGGVMKSARLRERLAEIVKGWLKEKGAAEPKVLCGNDLELAVARGAAHFGLSHAGKGIRVRSGSPRSYYIGLEASEPAVPERTPQLKALCVVPHGWEAGVTSEVPGMEFGLVVGAMTQFRFFAAAERLEDSAGDLVAEWETELEELEPLKVTLPAGERADAGKLVRVNLTAGISEAGVVEMWCTQVGGEGKWRLEVSG